jgi:hypothetical protein
VTLAEHARTELSRAGWLDGDDAQFGEALLAAVEAFARGGWSGGSVGAGIDILTTLLRFKPLTPLTDDPAEWHDVSEFIGKPTWQSRRRSDAFSDDGGKTYRLQSDAPVRPDSWWVWLLWKARLRSDPPGGHVQSADYARTRLYRSDRARG